MLEKVKSLIANSLVKWFKRLPFAGRFRFKCLYWAYRTTNWHVRHREWDFVLDYLPPLGKWQNVSVLDVGCSRNLFCYEVEGRGYKLNGLDLEKPDFKYPAFFIQDDITTFKSETREYDFVTCISVLEHIGDDGKGDLDDQKKALENMVNALKVGGRLLLTVPTKEFARGHPWHGFSPLDYRALLPENCFVVQDIERAGQICCVLVRYK